MILEIFFTLYLITLLLSVIFAGVNYYRIRDKTSVHPQLVVFLLPFCINVISKLY